MSSHTAAGMLDDYLEGLLHETHVSTPASSAVAVTMLADAEPTVVHTSATVPIMPSPAQITADLLAEMDSDPAFAASTPAAAASSPMPEDIAADLLAEMDSDPAFAAVAAVTPIMLAQTAKPTLAPTPAPTPNSLQALLSSNPPSTLHPERRATDRSTRWLRLRCGEQTYALELLKVQEVVLPVPLLPLRGTSEAMLGIMNLRGQVVPVIDLGLHLGISPVDMDMQTRVVVLEENGETMGLRVSAVEDVTSLSTQQIEPPDNARLCRISNHLFRGIARLSQQPMILLDATQLLR